MTPIPVTIIESAYDWWDLIPATVGGLIGAMAGGVAAYVLAEKASRETVSRQRQLDLQADRARAIRVFGVFQTMFNGFFSTRAMIEGMLSRSAEDGKPHPTQRRVQAIVGTGGARSLEFNADDMSIFISADKPDYFQNLELLSRRYNAIMASLDDYRTLKDRRLSILFEASEHAVQTDGKVRSKVPTEIAGKLQVIDAQMENVIVPVIGMLRDNTEMMIRTAHDFGQTLRPYLKGSGKIPAFNVESVSKLYEVGLSQAD